MSRLHATGIIFDVDGTLAQSVEFFYEIALEVLALAGIPPVPRDRVYELMRRGVENPLVQLFPPDYPDPADRLKRITDSRMDEWLRRYHEETQAVPGSLELLHRLHHQGFQLGIATSSGRALPFLDTWGVRHLFGGIVGREDVFGGIVGQCILAGRRHPGSSPETPSGTRSEVSGTPAACASPGSVYWRLAH